MDQSWMIRWPEVYVGVGIVLVGLGIPLAVQGVGVGYVLIVVGAVMAALALLARRDRRTSSRIED